MGHSLSAVYIHGVFSTKNRHPYFEERALRDQLHTVLAGISNQRGCQSLQVGGVADHGHILARMNRTVTIADWMKEVKRESSIWVKQIEPLFTDFQWQSGYGAFSIAYRLLEDTTRYIAQQERHHQALTFQDEYRLLLSRHGLEWDERYVWD